MVDTFGSVLRQLREQRDMSVAELAARMHYTRPAVTNVENGVRPATAGFARAADEAMGTAPLLATLLDIEKGHDPMRRRALLALAGAAAGTAAVTADGTAALAATLRHGLHDATGNPADWDELAADVARRRVLDPAGLGPELLAHLAVAQQAIAGGDRDATRGAALLSLQYGLLLGDTGRVPTAHGYYATSAMLADRSGDTAASALVRARAASRGIYEGFTAARARAGIDAALHLAHPHSEAALEAHGAAVHLAGLTGNLADGTRALAAMYAAAEHLPAGAGVSPILRVLNFDVYLHGRAGTLAQTWGAYDYAAGQLAAVPLWDTDARLYLALAHVKAGDATTGLQIALDAVRALGFSNRVIGLGVRDVLAALPTGHRSADADALRGYAVTGPAPWETIRR